MIYLNPQELTSLRKLLEIENGHVLECFYEQGIILSVIANHEGVSNNKIYELKFENDRAEALFKIKYSEHL